MASEKAIDAALEHLPMYANFPSRVRKALDAAANVDGNKVNVTTVTAYECGFEAGKKKTAVEDNAQWNAACDDITKNLRKLLQPCRAHEGRKRAYNSGVDDAISVVDSMRRG